MRTVIVSAYAFSPTLGSEFAQGWNYVRAMKSRYRLVVLVGSSDGRMGDFALLDHPDVQALRDEVEIVPIQPDRFCKFIKWLDVRLGLSWLFVLGLRRWHYLAYCRARELCAGNSVDAVHQLGPVGFRNPGYLHRLGVPSYWGPIGGFQYVSLPFAWRSSPAYGVIALIRNISTFFSARMPYVRRAVCGFDALSFATMTNRDNFARLYGVNGPVLSDQATSWDMDTSSMPVKQEDARLNAVWCGSVDARKNVRLMVDIAHSLQQKQAPVHVTVIGSGPMLETAKALCNRLGLCNISFAGRLSREAVQVAFRDADILCFTSLSEANTSTFFEALENGCIPVALDLDGFSSNIDARIGYRIGIDAGWAGVVGRYSDILNHLARSPQARAEHRAAIAQCRDAYSWATLASRHAAVVDALMPPTRAA